MDSLDILNNLPHGSQKAIANKLKVSNGFVSSVLNHRFKKLTPLRFKILKEAIEIASNNVASNFRKRLIHKYFQENG